MKLDAVARPSADASFGGRFYLVGYLPTYAAALFLLVLVWAGAPGWSGRKDHQLSFTAAWATASHLSLGEVVMLALAVALAGRRAAAAPARDGRPGRKDRGRPGWERGGPSGGKGAAGIASPGHSNCPKAPNRPTRQFSERVRQATSYGAGSPRPTTCYGRPHSVTCSRR